jgi:two-component system KDP operon response regulator KdpE
VRILVVDDEPAVRRFLRTCLVPGGYQVSEAACGHEALAKVVERQPDLILLDLGLPDLDGLEVTRRLRDWCTVPVVVLSVRDSEADKVAALDAGADDYLTKPFGLQELLARLRAALRRGRQNQDQPVLVSGSLSIDLGHRQVLREGHPVDLTPTEFGLLKTLARKAGRVVTHGQLLQEVWGPISQDLHTLRVNISNLRKKLERDPARPVFLMTEPRVGYRLAIEDPPAYRDDP